ncbi:hypothetical protein ACFY1J_03020 [Streptomyces sp. NPDC001406]|uniref:hypothetical protein n=1 Tax=Streptomyces sp. NPDC001406 TaxID=3364572 RepID=UPI0036C7D94C
MSNNDESHLRIGRPDRAAEVIGPMVQRDPLLIVDADSVVAEWSKDAKRLLGHTAADAVGRPATILVEGPPHAGESVGCGRRGARVSSGAAGLDLRVEPVLRADGPVAWGVWAARRRGTETDEVGPAILDALFTQSPVGLVVVGADLRVNTASEGMRGAPVEQLPGRPVTEAFDMADPDGVKAMVRSVLDNDVPVLDRLVQGRPSAGSGRGTAGPPRQAERHWSPERRGAVMGGEDGVDEDGRAAEADAPRRPPGRSDRGCPVAKRRRPMPCCIAARSTT